MKVKPLLDAVSTIQPALNAKGIVPEFQYLYFNKDYVEATDGNLLIRADLEEECPEFAVEGKVFTSLLKTVNGKTIDIKVEEGKVHLKAGRTKSQLTLPAVKPISGVAFDIDEWTELPAGLLKGLALCRFTACPDQTAGALTGVRVEGNSVISCDKWRISVYTLEGEFPTCTIPVAMIDQLLRYKNAIEGYAIKEGILYVDLGGAKIGCTLVPGEYPTQALLGSMEQVKNSAELELTKDLKIAIAEAGKRQNIIQEKELEFDREAQFSVKKGAVRLFAQSEAVGLVEEVIEYPESSDLEFQFFINPIFLLETFEQTDTLLYCESTSVVAFKGDNFVHLVKTKMPDIEE